MNNWKYTDASHRIVFRILADGSMESCLVSAIDSWLAEGNTPEPADPPPPPDYSALRRAAYTAESDQLFFKEQRQEVAVGTWLAKVTEIKARWPLV